MSNNSQKVYLNDGEVQALRQRAEEVGISGRAWLTNYLRFLSKKDIVFLDENARKIFKLFSLERRNNGK